MSYAEAVEYAESIPPESKTLFEGGMGPQWVDQFAETMVSVELSQTLRRRAEEALEGVEPSFLRLNFLIGGALHSLFRGDTEKAISDIAKADVMLDRLVSLNEQIEGAK